MTRSQWTERRLGGIRQLDLAASQSLPSDYAKLTLSSSPFVATPSCRIADECGSIESVKAASEIYAPLSGEIVAINKKLEDQANLINKSPLENGAFPISLILTPRTRPLRSRAAFKRWDTDSCMIFTPHSLRAPCRLYALSFLRPLVFPHHSGWLFKVQLTNPAEFEDLLTEDGYKSLLEE